MIGSKCKIYALNPMINPAEADAVTGTVKESDCRILSKALVKYKVNDIRELSSLSWFTIIICWSEKIKVKQ